jgi:hypothetical protein
MKIAVALAALAVTLGAGDCGHVAPPPSSDCLTACAHLQQLGCSTSADLCERLCSSVAPNQPGFPGCVATATSCAAADACQ